MFTSPSNRYMEMWEWNDGVAIVAGVLMLAALALASDWAVRRIGWLRLRRAFNHLLPLVLGAGLINLAFRYVDCKTELLYLLLVAVVAHAWGRPQSGVVRWSANVALIFSPLPFLVGFQLLTYPAWKTPPEALPTNWPARPGAAPIFLFVFDEWSWERSTRAGGFLPFFKNLRALERQAVVFSEARALGSSTETSIPRLLFQTDAKMSFGRGTAFWDGDGKRRPTPETPSLFTAARSAGYNGCMYGFYLPYRKLLGDQVDYAAGRNLRPKNATLLGQVWFRFVANLRTATDPVSQKLFDKKRSSLSTRDRLSRYWYALNHEMLAKTMDIIERMPGNSFCVFHLPVPHFPYIFKPDGSYCGPYPKYDNPHDPAAYQGQLGYLDLVIGQLMNKLRDTGKFDSALIILTSDHSWRKDYVEEGLHQDVDAARHVPLVIKLPGQTNPVQIGETFVASRLSPLIEAVIKGTTDEVTLIRLLESNVEK